MSLSEAIVAAAPPLPLGRFDFASGKQVKKVTLHNGAKSRYPLRREHEDQYQGHCATFSTWMVKCRKNRPGLIKQQFRQLNYRNQENYYLGGDNLGVTRIGFYIRERSHNMSSVRGGGGGRVSPMLTTDDMGERWRGGGGAMMMSPFYPSG